MLIRYLKLIGNFLVSELLLRCLTLDIFRPILARIRAINGIIARIRATIITMAMLAC